MEKIHAGLCRVWNSCQNGFVPVFVARLTVFLAGFPALRAAQRTFMLAASFRAHAHVAAECSPCIGASWQAPWRGS